MGRRSTRAQQAGAALRGRPLAAAAVREDPWHVMLRASGRMPVGRISPGPLL